MIKSTCKAFDSTAKDQRTLQIIGGSWEIRNCSVMRRTVTGIHADNIGRTKPNIMQMHRGGEFLHN